MKVYYFVQCSEYVLTGLPHTALCIASHGKHKKNKKATEVYLIN